MALSSLLLQITYLFYNFSEYLRFIYRDRRKTLEAHCCAIGFIVRRYLTIIKERIKNRQFHIFT